ncbi:MAG: PA14 domain-containing protein [Anaerolineae bacterium]
MIERLSSVFALALLIAFVLPHGVAAQGPITPQHTDPNWSAAYWDNMSLSGSPEVVRSDATLNFNWGTDSPSPEISADRFSARWLRYIDVTPGTYRFIVTSDDGIRLWIDGELVLDEWNDHAETTFYVDHYLADGHHLLQVEYYENTGLAVASVSWVRSTQAVGQWQAEYYTNMSLSGTPAVTRNEAAIDFNWVTGSPDPAVVPADHFSARFTRTMDFPADNYTFMLTTDDGARLWVNGHLLIDAWFEQAATLYTEDIYLSEGPVELMVEYYENTGFARLQLSWEPDVTGVPSDQAIVVDNADPSFVRGGSASGWRTANEGYRDSLLWTRNNDRVRPDYNWARWYPNLDPGVYEIFVYIPYRYTTTTQARYWVAHQGGITLRIVDQSLNGDQWVSLGTFTLRGDGSDYVSLADVTFEPYLSRLLAFDAVRWVPR